MRHLYQSDAPFALARRVGEVAMLLVFGLLVVPSPAAGVTVAALQQEWRQLFPPPATTEAVALVATVGAHAPYAIVEKDFLLGRLSDRAFPSPSTSLLRIRNHPPPIRQAHAACVKIITPYWHGAGIMISAAGDVLTSYHLVAGAPSVTVQMLDGRLLATTNVTAFSSIHDLALLHVDDGPFTFLPVSDKTIPAPGTALSIVGHPGENSWKLDSGTAIRFVAESGTDVLHFQANIGQGNSGGPIVDAAGRLCALTACAATLTDGSKVKVGVSSRAIRAFLNSPRHPATLADLAAAEKDRQTADLLQGLCLLTEEWMRDWLVAMSQVTITPAGPAPDLREGQRVTFRNMDRAAEATIKLLLLKTMMARCVDPSTPDPLLVAGGRELAGSLDQLLDCTTLLSRANGKTPDDVRRALDGIRQSRAEATLQFCRALSSLVQAGHESDSRQGASPGFHRLETLHERYTPPGRYFETSRSEGRS